MTRDIPKTPVRRSRRYQPLATPSRKALRESQCAWASPVIHIRPTIPLLDALHEQTEEPEGSDEDNEVENETVFYEAFSNTRPVTMVYRGNRVIEENGGMATFHVGDTVLVATDEIAKTGKPPSIAVIVAMWEVRPAGDEGHLRTRMRVRVHWFLRPTELASIRAKRDHTPNEIYYSVKSGEIVVPEVISAHCRVSVDPQSFRAKPLATPSKSKKPWPTSPSKRGSARRKSLFSESEQSQSDEDDEEVDSDIENAPQKLQMTGVWATGAKSTIPSAHNTFYCRAAVDSYKGLFYDFDWDARQRMARYAFTPENAEMEEDAKKWEWGAGLEWNVAVEETSKSKASKQKKRLARVPAPRKRIKLEEDGSENENAGESSGTEDDFVADDDSDSDGGEEVEEEGESEDEGNGLHTSDEDDSHAVQEPRTPSKSRKRKRQSASPSKAKSRAQKKTGEGVPTTPRKPRNNAGAIAQPTPHSKRALSRREKAKHKATTKGGKRKGRHFKITPGTLGYTNEDLSHLPKDPWLRAMHMLHVGSRPDALPCREEEFDRVLRSVGDLLEEGNGGCIYISGVPGTGKTATIHAIVRELKRMAESSEINPFTYCEINGLKIPEPAAAYNLLWETVSGHDVAKDGHLKTSSKESLKALTRHFSGGGGRGRGPGGHACVVLMDELDQLVTAKQDVVYNFFNWPTLAGSRLVVLAVANTMDLPERVMTGRVRSRLGMTRINFQPYTGAQLEKIVQARLNTAKDGLVDADSSPVKDVIAPDAIKFAAMKVSSISGDARRVLDICRRTVEQVQADKRTARMVDVKSVIAVMQNSPTAAYLRECSLHERMMLASLIKCIKREGVTEIKWGEVQHQHLNYINVLTLASDPSRRPTSTEFNMVLDSLVASRAMLVETGAGVSRKPESEKKVALNLEQSEVERVLSEVGGSRWKAVLG